MSAYFQLIDNSDVDQVVVPDVIEYIHFLQLKVHKYEGSFQGWNHEPEKLMPWRNNDKPAESFEACGTNSGSGPSPTLLFASKIDEKNITLSPPITGSSQKLEPGLNTATPFKNMDHPPGITNNTFPIPISSSPNFFPPRKSIGLGEMPHVTHRLPSDAGNGIYQPSVECQTVTATNEKLKEKELAIEGGAISTSSVYSKGLLDTLTHELQSSGVDLSQASISVQIELRKQENIIRPTMPMSMEVLLANVKVAIIGGGLMGSGIQTAKECPKSGWVSIEINIDTVEL
ncbi:transcription factor BIM2-like [Arachis stenosperma]|uniref:transcription factor BIM2-like n=1 Tax=Arachis stenosperma TaxID=217475 RepID=UPI0025AC88A3|nr:transcription factor BIM2-like [Arachis stenosperma]